jgi:hypothetical protein
MTEIFAADAREECGRGDIEMLCDAGCEVLATESKRDT